MLINFNNETHIFKNYILKRKRKTYKNIIFFKKLNKYFTL